MPDVCTSLVRGKMLRATQVDACGVPVLGAQSFPNNVVTKGFISVAYANEVDDGEEIDQPDANGDSCVLVPPCPRIKWVNVTLTLCKVDPYLFTLMTGWPLVLDEDGNATGFRWRQEVECESGVAIELWTGTKSARRCDPDVPLPRYGYLLLPYLTSAYVSDFTVENAVANFTIVGKGIEGGGWDVGPYDVLRGLASLLPLADAIGEGDLMHFEVTTLPPPNEICGQYPTPIGFTAANVAPPGAPFDVNVQNTFLPAVPANMIDFGDGTAPVAGTVILGAPGTTHTYTTAGTYLVTVTHTATGAESRQLIVVA